MEKEAFCYNNTEMRNKSQEKILGIIIGNEIEFKSQIINLCKKSFEKSWALLRLTKYLSDSKKLIFNPVQQLFI